MEEIKAGDVVYLKSGSPKMTVRWVEKGRAAVTWFDKNDSKSDAFELEMLTKINPVKTDTFNGDAI